MYNVSDVVPGVTLRCHDSTCPTVLSLPCPSSVVLNMDAEKLSSIKKSLDNLGIAIDKVVEKSIVFESRLNWIEGKVTVPPDYEIDQQQGDTEIL